MTARDGEISSEHKAGEFQELLKLSGGYEEQRVLGAEWIVDKEAAACVRKQNYTGLLQGSVDLQIPDPVLKQVDVEKVLHLTSG